MVWAEVLKVCEAVTLAKGLAWSGARWLTPVGTTTIRLARECLVLPCLIFFKRVCITQSITEVLSMTHLSIFKDHMATLEIRIIDLLQKEQTKGVLKTLHCIQVGGSCGPSDMSFFVYL